MFIPFNWDYELCNVNQFSDLPPVWYAWNALGIYWKYFRNNEYEAQKFYTMAEVLLQQP